MYSKYMLRHSHIHNNNYFNTYDITHSDYKVPLYCGVWAHSLYTNHKVERFRPILTCTDDLNTQSLLQAKIIGMKLTPMNIYKND